jgi:maleate cis-trans isomerase
MARRQDSRRIGLLLPSSNSVQEPDFCSVLPKHITLHVARMGLSTVEADSTLRIVQEIEAESRKLADVDVDVIVFAAQRHRLRSRADCADQRGKRQAGHHGLDRAA